MHYEQAAAQMAEAAQTSDPNKRSNKPASQTTPMYASISLPGVRVVLRSRKKEKKE
jgi:hypothetical protein